MGLSWKFDCISEGLISSGPVSTTGGYVAKENPDQERFSVFERHGSLRGDDSIQCSGDNKSDELTGEWIAKCVSSKTLFDAGGRLLSLSAAGFATTWRTHHAFSARCGIMLSQKAAHASSGVVPTDHSNSKQTEKVDDRIVICGDELPFRGTPSWMLRSPRFYRKWKIDLYVRSTCADPHILISVAPHYYAYGNGKEMPSDGEERLHLPTEQNDDEENAMIWPCNMEAKAMYDKRILETPLVYEEPYAISTEFGTNGMFLWSDHWERYGEQVSDHRLQPFFSKEDSLYQAPLPLSFILSSSDQKRGAVEKDIGRNGRTVENTPLGYQGLIRLQWSTVGLRSDTQPHNTSVATLSVFVGANPPQGAQTSEPGTPSEAANSSPKDLKFSGKDIEWQHAFDTTLELDPEASNLLFVPYATLLECGDEVLLLS
ncbi:unnamed protein product [Phytomonas sp. EM1]|nr:unnamed protein product [Phytomonas sp. EM1]|eukprot:CCW60579.1 unnamed protein product [Phytomonas sp. isolate EM1]